jgi:uncharacterized membrane-anchored protein
MALFQKKAFIILVILQIVVLGAMIGQKKYLLKTGKVVRLKCQPVDPRSLFSGDYVILNYEISRLKRINGENWDDLNTRNLKFKRSDVIYSALQQKDDSPFWKVIEVAKNINDLNKRYEVVLRGRVVSTYHMTVRYGVESYFVPQYEGKRIEKIIKDVSVDVAVNSSGVSGIKKLYIKDKAVVFK